MIYNEIGDSMIPICEEKHVNRLKTNNIKIVERYKKTPQAKAFYTRSIMDEHNDEISNCIRVEKEFFHNDKSIYKEVKYSIDIRYTFLDHLKSDKVLECPSCGYSSSSQDFVAGCPYCQTDFTIDYGRKSNKTTRIKRNSNTIPAILGSLAFLIIFIMLYLFQTVNVMFVLLATIFFLTAAVLFIFNAGANHAAEIDDLWYEFKILSMNINEQRVFNDLYFQLSEIYYEDNNKEFNNLIDFEIIKYISAEYDKDEKGTNILLTYDVRKFFFDGKKINKTETTEKVKLYRNQKVRHKNSKIYASRCKNCGSTLEKDKEECAYCGSKNNSTVGWVIDKFMKVKQKRKSYNLKL